MYKKIKANNYNIHFIKTDKFKTITVKVNFKRKIIKEDITIRNLLVDTLFASTKKYPTKRLMDMETENLYGLSYRGFVFVSGIYSILSLETTFLNEKYTEKGMNKQSIDFLHEILFNPNVNNTKFDEDSFNLAYHNIYDELKSLKENANMYSQIRLLELLDDPAISMRSAGYIKDLEKIDSKKIYDYYKDVINNDIIDIFIIGNIDNSLVDYIKDTFSFSKRDNTSLDHIYKPKNYHKPENYYMEDNDTTQSNLVLGFKLMNLSDFERRYVINIYNYILGGSPDSKLFRNVREKESLCYHISSNSYPLTSLLLIKAGINASNYNKTLKLIIKETENIKNGDFTKEDIEKGIITYKSSLKEMKDNPNGLLSLYMSIYYTNSDNYNNKIKYIEKVTKKDIIALASKIKLDTVYLLKGNINETD